MSKKIKVLVVYPHLKPEVMEIDNDLEMMQAIVGGRFRTVFIDDDEGTVLIVNKEGKINGMPPNRYLQNPSGKLIDVLFGTFLLCGTDFDSFCSLTSVQSRKYTELFTEIRVTI